MITREDGGPFGPELFQEILENLGAPVASDPSTALYDTPLEELQPPPDGAVYTEVNVGDVHKMEDGRAYRATAGGWVPAAHIPACVADS